MLAIKIKRLIYKIRIEYLNLNNLIMVVAILIAISWAWGSVGVMERNFKLQKIIEEKQRQLKLTELEVAKLNLENKYHASNEYKELAVRERLGLVNADEKVLILPPNTGNFKKFEFDQNAVIQKNRKKPGNLEQWITFLLGGNNSTN